MTGVAKFFIVGVAALGAAGVKTIGAGAVKGAPSLLAGGTAAKAARSVARHAIVDESSILQPLLHSLGGGDAATSSAGPLAPDWLGAIPAQSPSESRGSRWPPAFEAALSQPHVAQETDAQRSARLAHETEMRLLEQARQQQLQFQQLQAQQLQLQQQIHGLSYPYHP